MIGSPAQVRFFGLDQLFEAMSFAEQGGIAVHRERRLRGSPRNVLHLGVVFRVIGGREQLRSWGRDHAQWEAWLEDQEGEPGLFFFTVAGATARRLEAELGIAEKSSPAGAEL